MATFDIFIKGINPERLDESEQIKKQLTEALQITLTDVDELFALPNGACIRRDTPEKEAIEYQRALTKLGLICLYSPTKKLTNLELEPIEEELVETSLICPHCEYEMPIEDGVKPEKCTQCGIDIAKFLAQKQAQEEREAMKAKLLTSQNIQKALEEKRLQEEAERQRKVELEKEVLEELGVKVEEKKRLNLKTLSIGGGLVTLALGASYFFTTTTSQIAPQTTTTTTATQSSSASNIQLDSPTTNAPLDAQQAMQKTHDQAAQVLNSFGLDPDAFAKAGENAVPVAMNENSVSQQVAVTDGATSTNKSTPAVSPVMTNTPSITEANVVKSHSQQPVTPPVLNTAELFAAIKNDLTWDKFLAQNSKMLLERQLPDKALQLSKFIVAHDVYVDTLGELLRTAQQNKQNVLVALENRLVSLPIEQQAVYFAQAGGYLAMENGTNSLLIKAENLLTSLTAPELQFPTVLKLAVIYAKTSNIANSNNYFNKINTLLSATTDLDAQAQLRAAVAVAYFEINNAPVATQWLNSTEPMIKQLKRESINVIIDSYARCNQWQAILKVLAITPENNDALIYRALTVALKAGFIPSAIELHKALHSTFYQVLADILIADYSPAIASSLIETAEQIADSLNSTEKVLVLSQAIDYFGRNKNKSQLERLIKTNKELLATLPASTEKDALLNAIAEHYAHGLQTEQASFLLTGIQATPLKTSLNVQINQFAKVSELLK